MVLQARNNGVTLKNDAEKNKWKVLAKLDHRLARFPCMATLSKLGLQQCFKELLAECQLTALFTYIPSYQVLTLEFLTTLYVKIERRDIPWIKFRLRNKEYTLTMEQLREMFGCVGTDYREPMQFDSSTFWKVITNKRKDYRANRAKGSSLRNPVLRIIQKACACHPFNRVEHGSVQREELFLLWSVVHKRPFNWVFALIKTMERTSKKTKGFIGCGAIVSFIARHLGVSTSALTADIGEPLLDLQFLFRASVIGVDGVGRAYLLQKKGGDHYPLPDLVNTYINGPTHPVNWGMIAPIHRQMVAQYPPQGEFRTAEPSERYRVRQPPPEIREHPAGMNDDQPEEFADDDVEEPARPHHEDPGPSSSRTRTRGDRQEEELEFLRARVESWGTFQEEHWSQIDTRLGGIETRQGEQWSQFDTRLGRIESRQEEFGTRLGRFESRQEEFGTRLGRMESSQTAFYATYDTNWNTSVQFMDEMRGYFARQQPPPSDQ